MNKNLKVGDYIYFKYNTMYVVGKIIEFFNDLECIIDCYSTTELPKSTQELENNLNENYKYYGYENYIKVEELNVLKFENPNVENKIRITNNEITESLKPIFKYQLVYGFDSYNYIIGRVLSYSYTGEIKILGIKTIMLPKNEQEYIEMINSNKNEEFNLREYFDHIKLHHLFKSKEYQTEMKRIEMLVQAYLNK